MLGATASRPDTAGSDKKGDITPIASASHLATITANGAIELATLGPRTLSSSRVTLTGGSVSIGTPTEWPISSATSFMLAESDQGPLGFQAVPRGLGLYAYAPDFGLRLDGLVSLNGGQLAQYSVVDKSDGDLFLTLWQGPHHDLMASNYKSLEAAVAALSGMTFADSNQGLKLSPHPTKFSNYQLVEEMLTIEFGPYLAELQDSNIGPAVPAWPGMAGEGGDFYRIQEGDDMQKEVLFVAPTATVRLVEWETDGTHDQVTDTKVDALINNLTVDWQTN